MDKLKVVDLADTLNTDYPPETTEHAYRRGYYDAMQVLWSEMGLIPGRASETFGEQLENFIYTELLDWENADTSEMVKPPQFDFRYRRKK